MDKDQDFTQQSQPPHNQPGHIYGRGDLAPGTIVDGRYKVMRKLGEGGMAVVYLIEQIFLNDTLALKVLTTGLSETSTVRFQKEAQVCRMLDHPNLIKVLDFALLEDDSPYLVMEFIDGESLADRLKRKGQLSEVETIDIFIQIMDGLAYAHDQNVIHRDLKPSNVMLFQGPDHQLRVKILDFGIAKMTGLGSLNVMTLTNTGEIFGSPLFMSPEQCLGRTVDSRSDLYSIGCALYQVLTGAPPFSGDSALSTMMLHLEGTPLPLKQASLGKVFSPGIEKVTMKLLQKLPQDRYQSARDVRDDLQATKAKRALKAEKQVLEPKGSTGESSKIPRAVLIAISLMVVLAAGSVMALFLPKKLTSNPPVAGNSELSKETSLSAAPTPLPFFANCSIDNWKRGLCGNGPWILRFPENGAGKIALAGDPRGMDVTLLKMQLAQGVVKIVHAGPLLFTSPLVHIEPKELMRFRPDEIQQLSLEENQVDDQTITALSYFHNLQSLCLDNCLNLTDACLPSLANLHNLVYLHVKLNSDHVNSYKLGCVIANSNIDVFRGDYFEGCDALCRGISTSNKIGIIRFQKCDITDRGLAELTKLPNLQRLELLGDKSIKDQSFAKLAGCKRLKSILIHDIELTTDSFRFLKTLPSGCRINLLDLPKWSEADRDLYNRNFPTGCVP